MAQKRRGGAGAGAGFRPPELKGTLGTLLRTTLHQAGVVRDAAREALGQGRERLSQARASRRRSEVLADLGELVLDLIRRGEIDLGELPEAQDLVAHLDEMDAEEPEPPPARASTRERFDLRGARDAEDGTVSSGARWAPPRSAKPAAERVWRPPGATPRDDEEQPTAPERKAALRPAAPRKGGISFEGGEDEDGDLAEYMHPDDVPPKGAPNT